MLNLQGLKECLVQSSTEYTPGKSVNEKAFLPLQMLCCLGLRNIILYGFLPNPLVAILMHLRALSLTHCLTVWPSLLLTLINLPYPQSLPLQSPSSSPDSPTPTLPDT